mgnify:CR=1 FL=1
MGSKEDALKSWSLLAVLIGAIFVSWPVLGKYFNSPVWTLAIVFLGTGIGVCFLHVNELRNIDPPELWKIAIILVITALNVWGVHAYGMNSGDKSIPTGAFLATVSISMTLIAPVYDFFATGSIPTLKQIIGYGFGAAAIYFIQGGTK